MAHEQEKVQENDEQQQILGQPHPVPTRCSTTHRDEIASPIAGGRTTQRMAKKASSEKRPSERGRPSAVPSSGDRMHAYSL